MMYPNMYVGDAGKSTAAKGKAVFDHNIDAFAKVLSAVKRDEITAELLERFPRERSHRSHLTSACDHGLTGGGRR
ncbi:MAG TPA: hypothetical protein DIC52_22725 [Candidatus Latescibacteria bacterium]|jgi:hypothetical protein|nr:hypothetical protein [Candidatus Latescibacterota bacterium]